MGNECERAAEGCIDEHLKDFDQKLSLAFQEDSDLNLKLQDLR